MKIKLGNKGAMSATTAIVVAVIASVVIGWFLFGNKTTPVSVVQPSGPSNPSPIVTSAKTVRLRIVDVDNSTVSPAYTFGQNVVWFLSGAYQSNALAVALGSSYTTAISTADPGATGTFFVAPNLTSCSSPIVSFGQNALLESVDVPAKRFQVGQIREYNSGGTVISAYTDINLTTGGAIAVGAGGTTSTLKVEVSGENTTDALYGCNNYPGEGLAAIVRLNTSVWDKSTSGLTTGQNVQSLTPLSEEASYVTNTFSTGAGYEYLYYLLAPVRSNTLNAKEPNLPTVYSTSFTANAKSGQNPTGIHEIEIYFIPRVRYYSTVSGQYKTAFATDDVTPVRVIASTMNKTIEVS